MIFMIRKWYCMSETGLDYGEAKNMSWKVMIHIVVLYILLNTGRGCIDEVLTHDGKKISVERRYIRCYPHGRLA